MILTEGAGKFGRLLWAMNWQAKVDRLGPDMPEYTDEYFLHVQPVRRKGALGPPDQHRPRRRPDRLRRHLPGGSGDAVVERLDGDERRLLRAPEPDGGSLLKSGTTTSRVVQTSSAAAPARTSRQSRSPSGPWTHPAHRERQRQRRRHQPTRGASAARRPTYPDIKCLSLTGQVLATMPHGLAQVDATGQMVLLQEGMPEQRWGVSASSIWPRALSPGSEPRRATRSSTNSGRRSELSDSRRCTRSGTASIRRHSVIDCFPREDAHSGCIGGSAG